MSVHLVYLGEFGPLLVFHFNILSVKVRADGLDSSNGSSLEATNSYKKTKTKRQTKT